MKHRQQLPVAGSKQSREILLPLFDAPFSAGQQLTQVLERGGIAKEDGQVLRDRSHFRIGARH
jgi:hypothetical protein